MQTLSQVLLLVRPKSVLDEASLSFELAEMETS